MARSVDADTADRLRKQAASCRSVAGAARRMEAAAALIAIAREYEARADGLEAAQANTLL
jgi:hypothetical protein